jgi:hypothetical protein
VKGVKEKNNVLWSEYKLQTYFTIRERIDYFVIINEEKGGVKGIVQGFISLIKLEKELFKKLKRDYKDMKCNLKE